MLQHKRIVLLFVVTLQLISIVFGVIQWQRAERSDERYSSSLLLGQQVAWDKIVERQSQVLSGFTAEISSNQDLIVAIRNGKQSEYGTILDRYRDKYADRSALVELFGSDGLLLYTSRSDMSLTNSLEVRSLERMIQGRYSLAGVNQLDARNYQILAAQNLEKERTIVGVIVIAQPIHDALEELKLNFNANAYMVNLHGRVNDATGPGSWLVDNLETRLRTANVVRGRRDKKSSIAVSQPVTNTEGRIIGAVITVRDTTEDYNDDQFFTISSASIGLLIAAIVGSGSFWFFRRGGHPLVRADHVSKEPTKSERSTGLADENIRTSEEKGQVITHEISYLRDEQVNFSMVRVERRRQNRRQELLIRQQLVELAETLDRKDRDAILTDLEYALQADSESQRNQLATLTVFLGKMASLVKAKYGVGDAAR